MAVASYQPATSDPAGFGVIIASTVSGNSTNGKAVASPRRRVALPALSAARSPGTPPPMAAAFPPPCARPRSRHDRRGHTAPRAAAARLVDRPTTTWPTTRPAASRPGDTRTPIRCSAAPEQRRHDQHPRPPGAASPAISAGTGLPPDRPARRRAAAAGHCDIGAFEFVPPPPHGGGLPPPVAGKLVNAAPKRGTVKIKRPGRKHFSLLRGPAQIPVGTIIDTRKGRIT